MTAIVEARRRPTSFLFLLGEWSISHLGHFAVLAILSIYFLRTLALPAGQAATLMLLASLSFRLIRIFLAPLLDRLPTRTAILLALSLCCAGYLGLATTTNVFTTGALLVAIGAGYGTNALAVKTLAGRSRGAESPLLRYASLSTGLNLAAALGPIVGNALFLHWHPRSAFSLAACAYGLSALVALGLPDDERTSTRRPNWIAGMRLVLRLSALRKAMLFTALGWFLYAQLYATLPLFVRAGVGRAELLGTFFSLNAVLVVGGQLPLSRLLLRWRLPAGRLVQAAYLSFAAGFALLWLWPYWQVAYGSIVLWTIGEMLLMPALDTFVAQATTDEHRLVAFALNAIAVGAGEGLGNFVGVAMAGWLLEVGALHHLYGAFTVCALVAAIVLAVVEQRVQGAEAA